MASQPFRVSGALGPRIICSSGCSLLLAESSGLPSPAGSQQLSQFSCDCTIPVRSSINTVPPIFLLSSPHPSAPPHLSFIPVPPAKHAPYTQQVPPEAHNDNHPESEGRNQTIHGDFEDCFFILWSNKFKRANFFWRLYMLGGGGGLCQRCYLC